MPGPEIAPVQTVLAPPAHEQWAGRIASSGTGYLAVWTETASRTMSIHGTRIAAGGTPLDHPPLVIADTPNSEVSPDVVWDGRRYLVVWAIELEGVFARFVETDGAMSPPLRVSAGHGAFPRATFNGREFLVAWRGEEGFEAAVVDANGQVTRHLDLGPAFNSSALTAVTAVGDVFYLATIDIDAAVERPAGPVAEIGILPIRNDGSISRRVVAGSMIVADAVAPVNLQAASRGNDAVMAWSNGTKTYTLRIDGAGFEEVQSFDGDLNALVADRSGYLIVYDDGGGRWVRRVGGITAAPIASLPGPSRVLSGADDALVVSESADLYAQRLDDGTFAPLSVAPRHQSLPAIAAAGSLRLAAWTEVIEGQSIIVAARLGPQGTLDSHGIELPFATSVRIATGPGQWLIVLHEGNRVAGARVAFDGTLLDPEPFTIADQIYYPDRIVAAWDGTRYVVAFMNGVPNRLGGSFAVAAARVTAEGIVESPLIQASPFASHRSPAIAAGRDGSLVVWTHGDGTLRGALLSRAGSVTPIAFPATARFRTGDIDVAWNGETWLVAAAEQSEHIVWFFVSPTGVVTPAPAGAYVPYVATFSVLIDVEPIDDGFLLVYASDDGAIHAAAINRNGYVAHGPAAVGTMTIYHRHVSAAGSTIIYARPTETGRDRLTRVFVRELAVTENAPKRRAVR